MKANRNKIAAMESELPIPSPPSSIQEVELLVQQLYKPGPATTYGIINKQLMQLQHSPDGWNMADALMASEDSNVQFYAASTFIVKLNTEGYVKQQEDLNCERC